MICSDAARRHKDLGSEEQGVESGKLRIGLGMWTGTCYGVMGQSPGWGVLCGQSAWAVPPLLLGAGGRGGPRGMVARQGDQEPWIRSVIVSLLFCFL